MSEETPLGKAEYDKKLLVKNDANVEENTSLKKREKKVVKFTSGCMWKNIIYSIFYSYLILIGIFTSSILIILYPEAKVFFTESREDKIMKAWIINGFIYALGNFVKIISIYSCCYSSCCFNEVTISDSLRVRLIIFLFINITYILIYIIGLICFTDLIGYIFMESTVDFIKSGLGFMIFDFLVECIKFFILYYQI